MKRLLRSAAAAGEKYPSLPYVLPFGLFMVLLAVQESLPISQKAEYILRSFILLAALYLFSRRVIDLRISNWLSSVLLGIGVFVVWIAPDVLFPGYREHWLFQNPITGRLQASIGQAAREDSVLLFFRSLRAVILVPVIEELFWRAWLMRWLIDKDFFKIALGAWAPQAFWITALLFASEHGVYWEVGLLAGILYNWWMIRTKSLGDCILAHAVTNACLSAYVVFYGKWEYWY